MTQLRPDQVEYLLRPIQAHRVLKSKDVYGSFLAQHDVRAHLNRVFGFGNWGTRVVESVLIAEEKNTKGNWLATYRVTIALAIFDENGDPVTSYEDSANGASLSRVVCSRHGRSRTSRSELPRRPLGASDALYKL